MIDVSTISNDLIQYIGERKKHTTLFCIKGLLDWINSVSSNDYFYEKINNLSAADFNKIVDHPAIELWCANFIRAIRHNEKLEDDLFNEGLYYFQSILKLEDKNCINNNDYLIISDNQSNYTVFFNDTIVIDKIFHEISFLTSQPLLKNLLGDELQYPLESNIKNVQSCFRQGRELLELFYLRGYDLLVLIKAFSTVNNPANIITSCSTDDYNGLVVIAENNPPVLIAEQLIHEATHIHFTNIIYSNTELSDLFNRLPAFYSPFTESARPAVKLAHGIFSYIEVLSMWESLSNHPNISQEYFHLDKDEIQIFINKRISELNGRISCALRNLEALLKNDEKIIWKEIFDLFVPYKKLNTVEKLNINRFKMLNDIEKAELLLAINGSKISRISLPIIETGNFSKILGNHAYFCFSNELIISKHEDNLNNFSNVIDGYVSYLSNKEDITDAFVYIGQNPAEIRKASDLDSENKSGNFYEIPVCCQEYFSSNWEDSRNFYNGDLASFLIDNNIESNDQLLEIPWQLNSFAMYWGGGLTWHFPCSLNCESTISIVSKRLDILQKIDSSLCEKLLYIQQLPILWTKDGGIGLLESNDKNNNFEQIHWDSKSDIPNKLNKLGFDHTLAINNKYHKTISEILGNTWKYIFWKN